MIRPTVAVVLAVWLALDACTAARAELTAFWRHNPITPDAIADDPALAGMQSWSVMIMNTDGLWTSAGARLTLPSEHDFYRNPIGGFFRPSLSQQTMHPALTFHTYITQPQQLDSGLRPPSIVGGFPDIKAQYSFGGPLDPIPGIFTVAWGDSMGLSHPPGVYEIARFTFPMDVLPTVHPESLTAQANPTQITLIPTAIPEPSAIAVILASALGLSLRRTA